MGTTAGDARDLEEHWEELRSAHNRGECYPDCPYCDEEFESLFDFQTNEKEEETHEQLYL